VHGSGYSKLIIGEDRINAWWGDLEALAQNVSANSGRSCFTVSTMIVPRYGQAIAGALAEKLTALQPGPLDDPSVTLSAMAMPEQARKINERIDELLKGGGATNMSARHQPNGRLVTYEGRTYLLPTVILCDSMDHPLAREEFLFPYVAVVEASNADAMANLGPTLSLALYTDDEGLIDQAVRSDVSLVQPA
jgi:acyl-CoA reductase-like NAD-dependent aldehyde dehydrogenase